ncbi:MAG: hypothetical protein KAW12_00140 [Candidatus Aminicenantes bacterium]|nr:hypothetical protein [Candidatus Aminicenantes bacterium]
MFCSIYKLLISQAEDTGKGLPGFVTRHLHRCDDCREFSRVSVSLTHRLTEEAGEFFQGRDKGLEERIISAVDRERKTQPVLRRRPYFLPRPVLAATVLVLAVSLGIIFQVIPPGDAGTNNNLFNGLTVLELKLPEAPIEDIAVRVESPMTSELDGVKETVESGVKFIATVLDFNIPGAGGAPDRY